MGANQSRPSDALVNEKLRERLQAFHMSEDRAVSEKDGFLHIAGDARMWIPGASRSVALIAFQHQGIPLCLER